MQHWLIATIEGVCLGLALYLCVRLRMYLGPLIRARFGNRARQAYWLVTILVMIVLSNVGLFVFRRYLGSQTIADESLLLEMWFALIAMAVGIGLIYRRLSPKS
jgi:hypothetical protein